MTFKERALLLHVALLIPGRFSLSGQDKDTLGKLIISVAEMQTEEAEKAVDPLTYAPMLSRENVIEFVKLGNGKLPTP